MSDHSVMEKKSPETTLTAKLTAQYNEAVANGFVGTIEEYCKLRDHTQPSN